MKVIITSILCATSFAYCYFTRDAVYDAQAAERAAAASRSSRKWLPLCDCDKWRV